MDAPKRIASKTYKTVTRTTNATSRETAEATARASRAQAAWKAALPLTLLKLLAKAQGYDGVEATLHDYADAGLSVEFKFRPSEGAECEQVEVLRLTSEPREVNVVKNAFERLERFDAEGLERARVRKFAQEG